MTVVALTEGRFDDFVFLINALADYEHLSPPDAAAVERLRRDAGFVGAPEEAPSTTPRFEAALALNDAGQAVGYATWFHTYSTFLAKPSMYLEDLFVLEDARKSGAGSALFDHVRTLGEQRGCGRMEWEVLEWNALAREFYERRKATWMKDWLVYRINY